MQTTEEEGGGLCGSIGFSFPVVAMPVDVVGKRGGNHESFGLTSDFDEFTQM